eukprot:5923292-Prymnesium_polylepis.1
MNPNLPNWRAPPPSSISVQSASPELEVDLGTNGELNHAVENPPSCGAGALPRSEMTTASDNLQTQQLQYSV